eukprot:2563876-Prymnesium_polylepis.1
MSSSLAAGSKALVGVRFTGPLPFGFGGAGAAAFCFAAGCGPRFPQLAGSFEDMSTLRRAALPASRSRLLDCSCARETEITGAAAPRKRGERNAARPASLASMPC